MQILDIKILNGPNFWSIYRKKLIVLKLDLQDYEYRPTDTLKDFPEKLEALIPSLATHYCSRDVAGGFLQRLKEGTWLGHVVEHVALELQTLAGMDCGFGRTFSANEKGIYHALFSYQIEKAGIYAGKAAVAIVKCLAEQKAYLSLQEDIKNLQEMFAKEKP